jgi:O-antigen/teichoic acid export membrane protein
MSGAFMAGISRGAVAATGAATTIIVARLLGPSGAGSYSVAQTTIILLMIVTTLGAEHGVVYYVSSGRWSPHRAFRETQWFATAIGVVGIAIGLLARIFAPDLFHGLSPTMTIAAVVSVPFALSWLYASYVALSTDNYEGYALPSAIQSALAMCLVAVLAAIGGLTGAVLGFTVAHVITALITRRFAQPNAQRAQRLADRSDRTQLRRAVAFGIKGYATNVLQFLNYRLDLFILNATAASAVVGQYSVAVSITSILWLLPQALSDVLLPRIAALSARSGERSAEMLNLAETKGLRHAALLTVVVSIALALALMLLVAPIYGADFHQTTVLGLILLPGAASMSLATPLSATIVGRGRPGVLLATTLGVMAITVMLYALLIPPMHATGAALASSISYVTTFIATAVCYRHVTGSQPLRLMLPTRTEVADYLKLLSLLQERLRLLGKRFAPVAH